MHVPSARPIRPTRTTLLAAAIAAVSMALVAVAQPSAARAQDGTAAGLEARIRAGDCAAPGDVTALLGNVALPAATEGPDVAVSITDVMQPLSTLLAEPHVVLVQDPASAMGPICGPITGAAVEEDGLATALADAEGRIAGIAWLRELGAEATTVHLFLVAGPISAVEGSPAEATPSPSASPAPEPTPSPTDEPGAVPDAEIDPGDDIDVDVDG